MADHQFAGVAIASTMGGMPWAGSEELWSHAAHALRGRGIPIALNVKHWDPPAPEISRHQAAGCRVTIRSVPSNVFQRKRHLWFGDPSYRWLDGLRDHFVLISSSCTDGTRWGLECQKRNIPYAILVEVAAEFFWPDDASAADARQAFSGARRCFFVSEGNRRLIERQIAQPLSQATVVRNPFNVSWDAQVPWPEDDSVLALACVARLDARHKGQDLLLEVLRMPKWRERPIRLTLYGSGTNEGGFRHFVEVHGLENVQFAGFVHDIEAVWRRHHVLVLPSRVEGLPLAEVEAMLCGRPCLVTDVAGNAEVLEDGVTGFVARAPNPESLDEALEAVWQRRDELQSIGEAASRHIRKLIPARPGEAFADEIVKLINERQ